MKLSSINKLRHDLFPNKERFPSTSSDPNNCIIPTNNEIQTFLYFRQISKPFRQALTNLAVILEITVYLHPYKRPANETKVCGACRTIINNKLGNIIARSSEFLEHQSFESAFGPKSIELFPGRCIFQMAPMPADRIHVMAGHVHDGLQCSCISVRQRSLKKYIAGIREIDKHTSVLNLANNYSNDQRSQKLYTHISYTLLF